MKLAILVLFLISISGWAQNSRGTMAISPVSLGDNSPSVGYMKGDSRITYNFYLEINCYVTCDIGDLFKSYKDKPNVTFNVSVSNAIISPTYPTSVTTQLSGLYTGPSTAAGFGNATYGGIIGGTENGALWKGMAIDGAASALQLAESYNYQTLVTASIQPIAFRSAMSGGTLLNNATYNQVIGGFGSEPSGQGIVINGLTPAAQSLQSRADQPLVSALAQPIALYTTMNNAAPFGGVANSLIENGNASSWLATAEVISKWSAPLCCFGSSVATMNSVVAGLNYPTTSVVGTILTADQGISSEAQKFAPTTKPDASKSLLGIDLTSHVFVGNEVVLNPINEIKY